LITIDRRLAGLLPYRTVFFPSERALTQRLTGLQLARFFWTATELQNNRYLVRHDVTATICIDLSESLDAILKGMSQTFRRKIRTAERMNKVRVVRNGPEGSQEFLSLFNNFAHAKRSEVSPITSAVLKRYAPFSDFFLCYLDGELLCGHLNLVDWEAKRSRLIFSASQRLEHKEKARTCAIMNCYLHWHEMRTYREQGLSTYDLGGFSNGTNAGIDKFKVSFGGAIFNEHTYLCAGLPRLARLFVNRRYGKS
jgi:lipid II:glycine glycyltransferase (peptidoglycan interpeptide bridge formation enzyme)